MYSRSFQLMPRLCASMVFIFFLVSQVSGQPYGSGLEYDKLIGFEGAVETSFDGTLVNSARIVEGTRVSIERRKTDGQVLSSYGADLSQTHKELGDLRIIDIRLDNKAGCAMIGVSNKSDKLKKQVCFFAYLKPTGELLLHPLKSSQVLYGEILYESGEFYMTGLQTDIVDNGMNGFSLTNNSRIIIRYNGATNALDEIPNPSSENQDNTFERNGNLILPKIFYYLGDRPILKGAREGSVEVKATSLQFVFSENNNSFTLDRYLIHDAGLYSFAPVHDWALAYTCIREGQKVSEVYLSNGDVLGFGNGEYVRAVFHLTPAKDALAILTTQGLYRLQLNFSKASRLAETKMMKAYAEWQKRGPLEDEAERERRIKQQEERYMDSVLSVHFNQLLPFTKVRLYPEGLAIKDEGALRVKLLPFDEYYYTLNWSGVDAPGPLSLKHVSLHKDQNTIVVKALHYAYNGNILTAHKILPPVVEYNSVRVENLSDFVKKVSFQFTSKSKAHTLQVHIDGQVSDAFTLVNLGSNTYQVSLPVSFVSHWRKLEVAIKGELGNAVFEKELECDAFLDGDCFSTYYKEELTHYESAEDMIRTMNVAVIVANSAFDASEGSNLPQIALRSTELADSLIAVLKDHYGFHPDNIYLHENVTEKQLDSLMVELKDPLNSGMYSQLGAIRINLVLVMISHGIKDRVICSDGIDFDMSYALFQLTSSELFRSRVKDFLYLEDVCYGSLQEETTLRGYLPERKEDEDLCRYANSGAYVGLMASTDNNTVTAGKFIRHFTKALRNSKDKEMISLERIVYDMIDAGGFTTVPYFINLHKDVTARRSQKSYFFYTPNFFK